MWTSVNIKILYYASMGVAGGRWAAAPGGRVRVTGTAKWLF